MLRSPGVAVTSYNYSDIFNGAAREMVGLKLRFLRPYMGMAFGVWPKSYAKDLRAYAVLASATLEQCVEDLSWAYAYEISTELSVAAGAGTYRVLGNGSSVLLGLVEAFLGRSHGLRRDHYKRIVESIGFTVTTTLAQDDAFKQLGVLRGEGAHTYAITMKDANDVWTYTREVLGAARNFAIQCAGTAVGLIRT